MQTMDVDDLFAGLPEWRSQVYGVEDRRVAVWESCSLGMPYAIVGQDFFVAASWK